jgi:hypothetical protein
MPQLPECGFISINNIIIKYPKHQFLSIALEISVMNRRIEVETFT